MKLEHLPKLDQLDKAIIVALERDGRRAYRDIARDLQVAEATVRTRVNRLIDSGLIHITAVGDPLKLGVEVMAICLLRVQPGCVPQVADLLRSYPHVRFVGTSFGTADIIIQTLHPNIKSLHTFMTQTLPEAAPAISSMETFQLAEVHKSSWDWQAWFRYSQNSDADSASS